MKKKEQQQLIQKQFFCFYSYGLLLFQPEHTASYDLFISHSLAWDTADSSSEMFFFRGEIQAVWAVVMPAKEFWSYRIEGGFSRLCDGLRFLAG